MSIRPSPKDVDYDVVIVGAGPAGSCAAYELARSGLHVAVLEREVIPRYKTCGGGLVGRALRALPFSVEPVAERQCSVARIVVTSADFEHQCERDTPIVTMVMRDRFDALLASHAAAAGADVQNPCLVLGIDQDATAVTVQTNRGTLRARFLIAADGATGTTARAAGWRTHELAAPAVESEVTPVHTINSDEARFDIHFVPHGYAWVFPKRHHLSVGVLTTRRGPSALARSLDTYLDTTGVAVRHQERHGYVIPIRPRARVLARQRTLLVGDAAGLADPITAEGISFAIRSGQLAARAVIEADLVPADVRRRYHAHLERDLLGELKISRMFARALYDLPRIARRFTQLHGHEFAELLVDVMSGETTFTDLVRRPSFGRLLRAVAPVARWKRSTERDALRQG